MQHDLRLVVGCDNYYLLMNMLLINVLSSVDCVNFLIVNTEDDLEVYFITASSTSSMLYFYFPQSANVPRNSDKKII